MKKIFTLCLLASAVIMAQAKVYTLAELAEVVGTIQNTFEQNGETINETVGISADGDVYTIMLPTALVEDVTGIGFDDNNVILTKSHFTIVEGNDLTINPNETLLFAGAAQLEISGTLTATEALFAAAEGSEATAKGFRFIGDNAMADFEGCTFYKVNVNFGSTNGHLTAKDCLFNEQTSKGGNSAINFTSSCTGNVIESCSFIDNELSSIASGANVGIGATIKSNNITKTFASSRLYPAINMSVNSNDIIIEDNYIVGPAVNTRAGGIAVSNLIGNSTAGTIYVRNNHIQDCSYGITLTGGGNIRIEENYVLNNKYIANVNQGGSGINITCNSASAMANAYMRGNHIEGNVWGVTVVGSLTAINTNVNAGLLEPEEGQEFNPGENVFIDNGNNGVLYDWYNNTAAISYAQGNTWNVEEQTEEMIETVIVHNVDNPSLGGVSFMPPYSEPTAVTDIEASTVKGDNRYYNIMGQPVANPSAGIHIVNGRKVIVK